MNNILAIDGSTKSSGYAFIDENNVLKYGLITSNSTNVEKRIIIMRDEIIKIIKENNIKEVILEEVRPDGLNAHVGKVLTWLQGCIVVAVYEYNKNIKFDFIGATSWRSVLGIQGYRIQREEQKKRDIAYANKTYGLALTAEMDDEADAICILTSYLKGAETATIKKPLAPIGSEESAF